MALANIIFHLSFDIHQSSFSGQGSAARGPARQWITRNWQVENVKLNTLEDQTFLAFNE